MLRGCAHIAVVDLGLAKSLLSRSARRKMSSFPLPPLPRHTSTASMRDADVGERRRRLRHDVGLSTDCVILRAGQSGDCGGGGGGGVR